MTKRYSFGNSLKFLGLSLAQVLVYLFASVMLMLGTLMLIGSTFNKDPAKNKPALGVVFLAVCATIGGLPVWRVNRSKKRLISSSDRIERIRAASRMQKAIAIEQLAQELDLTQAQTLTLIRQGVSDGLLAGSLDSQAKLFFPGIDRNQIEFLEVKCDTCHASNAVEVTPGAPPRCKYCGNSLEEEIRNRRS